MRSNSQSNTVASHARKSAVVGLAIFGTVAAFVLGAQAGAALNGRVMQISVAKVPIPALANTAHSPVNTHVR